MGNTISGAGSTFHGVHLSAFPSATRVFQETDALGQPLLIGPDKTVVDIIKTLYNPKRIVSVAENFGFLTRDKKDRKYSPGVDDRYVFRSNQSLNDFRSETHLLLRCLCIEWERLGLPLTRDKERDVEVPDKEAAWIAIRDKTAIAPLISKHYDEIQFILSNVDIVLKNCVVRSVNWGWWVVSYSGKDASDINRFQPSLDAFAQAWATLRRTSRFEALSNELWDSAGDPMDTNPGYPFYRGDVNADGVPVTRIRMIEEARDLLDHARRRYSAKEFSSLWQAVLGEVDTRFGKYGLPGMPLCVAPLRRQQPGYKWAHQFRMTSSGLISAYDERGYNSQRVAWMVSYIYNLLISGFHCRLKALRMMLPGMYHDGASRRARLRTLRTSSQAGHCFMAEADYSNYDRNIPVNIVAAVTRIIADDMEDSDYYYDAAMYLHTSSHLIWPDYALGGESHGWAFAPGKLGLLSGVKLTSETGSFVNFIIHIQTLIEAEGWSVQDAVKYIAMYASDSVAIGSREERVYIQSDDSLLIASSLDALVRQGDAFTRLIKAAGLKGEVMLGDRFLMRHMARGRDTPVPSRVWQNTLSNEAPPENAVIFAVGLAARTDGLFGYKSVDPFDTGAFQLPTPCEVRYSRLMTESLLRFTTTASSSLKDVCDYLRLLPTVNTTRGQELADKFRVAATKELAIVELAKIKAMGKNAYSTELYRLLKERHKPASALILSEIIALDPELGGATDLLTAKEHKFFNYAVRSLGVKLVALRK
jgi:hypothetical protein